MRTLKVTLGVVFLLVGGARAQDAGCDISINVLPGTSATVASPGNPNSYPPGVRCRWSATTVSGYRISSNCVITLPQTQSCYLDRLLVSTAGDPQLAGADYYCGSGTLSKQSVGQKMTFGLLTSSNSPGGRFSCQLTAQASSSSTCSCGYKKVNRIVGGSSTQPNEYPMMAGIAYAGQGIKCGATIISNQWVITAGHCVVTRTASDTAVVVGEHDVSTGNDTSVTEVFRVATITVHPQYSSTNYQNDIAVVRVQGTITFSDRVGPVCLPFKFTSNSFAGAKLELLGWGTEYFGGPRYKVLQKVWVDGITNSQCQSAVPSVSTGQLCTYTPGKDACQDDSGGPVLYTDPYTGRLFLVGIISYGRSCAGDGEPAINTRVTTYLNWIVNAAPSSYCSV